MGYIVNGFQFHIRDRVETYFEEVQNDETEIEWDSDEEDSDEENDKDSDARIEENGSRALYTVGYIAFYIDRFTDSRTVGSVDSGVAESPYTYGSGCTDTDTGTNQFRRSRFIFCIDHTDISTKSAFASTTQPSSSTAPSTKLVAWKPPPGDTRQLLTINVDW
ncbi:hypothetical protein M9H77_04518 [Catharanthus roseus]|uniref:Uncharacterized protein n=1 Tax=Catharanthus roseus TaxID=4058 RepID=A0ACC0CEG7_CATRO|nr:hypothetical protein M9H77_04518 [Catharanthus roseus]